MAFDNLNLVAHLNLNKEEIELCTLYFKEKNIDKKLLLAFEYSNKLIQSNYLLALEFCYDAIDISKKEKKANKTTKFILKLVEIYTLNNDSIKAINCMEDTIMDYYNGKLDIKAYLILDGLARTYSANGQILSSFNTYSEALEISLENAAFFNASVSIINMGTCLAKFGNLRLSNSFFHLANIIYENYSLKHQLFKLNEKKLKEHGKVLYNKSINNHNVITTALSLTSKNITNNQIEYLLEETKNFNKHLKNDFLDGLYYVTKCEFEIYKKNIETAKIFLSKATEKLGNDSHFLINLNSQIELINSNYDLAIQHLNKYFQINNNSQHLNYNLVNNVNIFSDLYKIYSAANLKEELIFILQKLIQSGENNEHRTYIEHWAYHKLAAVDESLVDQNKFINCIERYEKFYEPILNFNIQKLERYRKKIKNHF